MNGEREGERKMKLVLKWLCDLWYTLKRKKKEGAVEEGEKPNLDKSNSVPGSIHMPYIEFLILFNTSINHIRFVTFGHTQLHYISHLQGFGAFHYRCHVFDDGKYLINCIGCPDKTKKVSISLTKHWARFYIH